MQEGPSIRPPLRLAAAHPLTRLEGLVELRQQAEAFLAAMESELVQQALTLPESEWTWEEVGRALGISGPQANRRYKHLAPESKRRKQKGVAIPRSRAGREKEVDRVARRNIPHDWYSELSQRQDEEDLRRGEEDDEEEQEGEDEAT